MKIKIIENSTNCNPGLFSERFKPEFRVCLEELNNSKIFLLSNRDKLVEFLVDEITKSEIKQT